MSAVDKVLKILFGDKSKRDLKVFQPYVDRVLSFEESISLLTNDELRGKTKEFKQRIEDAIQDKKNEIEQLRHQTEKETDINKIEIYYQDIDVLEKDAYEISQKVLSDLLPEAFAIVKETAKRFMNNAHLEVTATSFDRELSGKKDYVELKGEEKAVWDKTWDATGKEIVWDMVHYDVQLIGGAVLHEGKIAEMATGEGKTLVATLPVYLNALTGKGVHVVTVNTYLARRDAAWIGPIFEFHGLSVDCIDDHQPNSEERKKAYNADVTYGTNNEFGFDYLRDNMAHTPEDIVQKEHHYAIIDEVDSVLVDEARTPLIISGPVAKGEMQEFNQLKSKIERIVAAQRKYLTGVLAEAKKKIKEEYTKEGGFQLLRVFRGLPKNKSLIKFLSEEGMRALLQKTENFYMQDNNKEMPKVDQELFFVIDEKNNSIELTDKGIEYLTDKDEKEFFIMPDLSVEIVQIENLDQSDKEKAIRKDELFRNFSIKSERIHTLNQLLKAYTLFEKDIEYVVMDGNVKIVDEQTGRIMEGRRYSDGLHQAIEAKENVDVKDATQTLATVTLQNYFRMYKKLTGMTGTAETEAGEFWEIYKLDVVVIPTNRPIIRKDQQDLVFKTKREKYNAVIDEIQQLVEKDRPVLVGTTSVEISELLSRMLKIRKIKHNVLNAKLHKKEADIVAEAGYQGSVTIATNMAGRGTDIKISDLVKEAGGLAIIGTERHDSRRVDRQLRGRAGRQGDPGSSQFFVALEDNLMRLFGSERIAKIMDRMGLKEGEVIQHSMVTKSIERAQKKVEENNFGIRKRLLEYDDVMNKQREVIYKRRRNALIGERLSVDISNVIFDSLSSIVHDSKEVNDYEMLKYDLIRFMALDSPISEDEFRDQKEDVLSNKLYEYSYQQYLQKQESIAVSTFPVVKQIYENKKNQYQGIVVPFTDGKKHLQVVTDLEKAYDTRGKQLVIDFEKNITLALIDENWKDHLREMDELRTSVQTASYEQKDPLLVYKFESYELFRGMLDRVNKEILSFLFKGGLPIDMADQDVRQAEKRKREKMKLGRGGAPSSGRPLQGIPNHSEAPEITAPRKVGKKIGRNERVTIRNVDSGESREVKYKQAQPMIEEGQWVLKD